MATEQIKFDDVDFNADPPVKTLADVEVTFSYRDSGCMTLDLTEAHAAELDALMASWLEIATPFRPAPTTRTRANRTDSDGTATRTNAPVGNDGRKLTPAELKAFRTWAHDQGQDVERYDNGGYKYLKEQVAAWDTAREAAKTATDES